MSRDIEQYHFDPHDAITDINHLHCMQIHLNEDKPTVEDVQHMLYCLYAQSNVKPENIFIEPQDLRDMSHTLMREGDPYSYRYFVGDNNENHFSGGYIKRVWYGIGPEVRVYPFEFLERGFVMVGFFPIRIDVQSPKVKPERIDWGNWASLLTDKDIVQEDE
jgi:hypothetical protein